MPREAKSEEPGEQAAGPAPARSKLLVVSPGAEAFVQPSAHEFELVRLWQEPDAAARAARVALTLGSEPIGDEFVARFPALESVAVCAAGHDGVDLAAAQGRGVYATHAGSASAEDVADYAVAPYLAARRELIGNDRWVAAAAYWTAVASRAARSAASGSASWA
jgi:lactate dehydrogenase-like 2-hydroxyacid dehydrogenase